MDHINFNKHFPRKVKPIAQLMVLYASNQPLALAGVGLALSAGMLELIIVALAGIYTSGKPPENLPFALIQSAANSVLLAPQREFLISLFVLILTRLGLTLLAQYCLIVSSRKFFSDLGASGFFRIISQIPYLEINTSSIGHYTTLALDQIGRASRLTNLIGLAVIPSSLACVYFYAMFYISSTAAALFLVFIVSYVTFSLSIFRKLKNLGGLCDRSTKYINSFFVESLSAVGTIRSIAASKRIAEKYSEELSSYLQNYRRMELIQASSKLLPGIILLILSILFLYINPPTPGDNKTLILNWLGLSFAAIRIFPLLGQVYATAQIIASDFNACADVLNFIGGKEGFQKNLTELRKEESLNGSKRSLTHEVKPRIEISNLSFKYSPNGRYVLDNLNLILKPGKILGICGETGVGKSSIAHIIAGLIEPLSGTVRLYSDRQGERYELPLSGNVVVVSQSPFIISDTVEFNITFGRTASETELKRATERACLLDVIAEKPGGMKHILQYLGTNISGGQRQRISLARALLKNPLVLILDETTAGLDSLTKKEILEVMQNLKKETIIMIISHDEDVLRSCDEVMELKKNGVLVSK